jgi:hypothetical protein
MIFIIIKRVRYNEVKLEHADVLGEDFEQPIFSTFSGKGVDPVRYQYLRCLTLFGLDEEADLKHIKTFNKISDIERWSISPEIHPIDGTKMFLMSKEYQDIYFKAYNIMKKNSYDDKYILEHLPEEHILFENIDLVYYNYVKNNIPRYKDLYYDKIQELRICEFLS